MRVQLSIAMSICWMLVPLNPAFAQTWVPSNTGAPNTHWLSVASSSDGTKLAAVAGGNNPAIYTSKDSGYTWMQASTPSNYWVSIASSSDGTKLVAASSGGINPGFIYTSSDSGATWISNNAPILYWRSIAVQVTAPNWWQLPATIQAGPSTLRQTRGLPGPQTMCPICIGGP